MKNKFPLLLLSGLLITLLYNSCKKDSQNSIQVLFTNTPWQLASVVAHNFVGNSETSRDTLNVNCDSLQVFTFYKDNTCNYTNFDCLPQKSTTASWSLAPNKLYLIANIVCKDTTANGSSMPFIDAHILNLGQYSMVLETGDIQPNYSLTAKRRIVTYGFVSQKALGLN
jgi:hypothetical protein